MLQIATLLVLGVLVLLGAAYSYYWYSPPPEVPLLSATVRQEIVGNVCDPNVRISLRQLFEGSDHPTFTWAPLK